MYKQITSFTRQLLKPKIDHSGDIFERTKYLIAYRMTLFLSISLVFLSIILILFFDLIYGISTFLGLLGSAASFFYIRKTGEYKKFILSFNIFGAFLCVVTLFTLRNIPHVADGLWMIISCLFAFLTIGKRWGTLFCVVHTLSLCIYYSVFFREQIAYLGHITTPQLLSISVNVIICFFIIFFLSWQNIRTNQDAQNQLNDARLFLQDQFDLIYKQNEEKTVLLKEVHHRVKNNLQVIISLLRLQSRDMKDGEELAKYNESINRVITMSMIHEKIYRSEELSEVDIKDYFTSLAKDMIRSYHTNNEVDFTIKSKIDYLGLKPIVPLALIFNELFSNSMKYAFSPGDEARIFVEFNQLNQDSFEFIYFDNGKWKETLKANSFGLELIATLCEQLNGKFDLNTDKGTKYHFYFEKLNA